MNKKIILFLFLLIGICAISHVSAADDLNVTDEAMSSVNDEIVLEDNNIKNFTQLNSDINDGGADEVNLNSNYRFSVNDDYLLHEGIPIERSVIIHGNGHTIDGISRSQIFNIKGNGFAVFENLTIINGNSNAGAISGECYAINCTFIGNHAGDNGGALGAESVAIDSTFINNSANGDGGAIYKGYAYNCKFEGNEAIYAFNSHGGAIYGGYAENCTFINNKASFGGAMYYDSLGSWNIVLGCVFEGNYAEYSGGALYGCDAINSTFTRNSAKYGDGGAMYGGAALNCSYWDNSAAGSSNDVYGTSFADATLTVSDFTSYYHSGDVLKVKLIDDESAVVNDGYITVKVYSDDKLVATDHFISGSGWNVNLGVGKYRAVFSIDHQSYNVVPVNITIIIDKATAKVSASSLATVYNVNKYLVVTLKDNRNKPINGAKVSVDLNGVKTFTTNNKGQIKVSVASLVPKTYVAKITFEGNKNYIKASTSAKVTVKKANPKLTAKKKTFKAKVKTKKYAVVLKDNKGNALKKAKLTLNVKGKSYKATTNTKGKATFKIKKLTKKGKHTANIKFKGDKCFNALNKKVKIIIK